MVYPFGQSDLVDSLKGLVKYRLEHRHPRWAQEVGLYKYEEPLQYRMWNMRFQIRKSGSGIAPNSRSTPALRMEDKTDLLSCLLTLRFEQIGAFILAFVVLTLQARDFCKASD